MKTEEFWVLVIDHDYGANIDICRTRQTAKRLLLDYVIDDWANEYNTLMPEDPDEAIEAYFEDHPHGDWYTIEKRQVQ